MITITAKKILRRNRRFGLQALKYRDKGSARAEKAVKKTIADIILEETDYIAPNPTESMLPEGVLSEEAIALFNTQVYEKIKSDAAVEFDGEGRDSGAYLTFDMEKNPGLAGIYMDIFKLAISASASINGEADSRKEIQNCEATIEKAKAEIDVLEEECRQREENLRRKNSFGSRKKNTSGLEMEITQWKGRLTVRHTSLRDHESVKSTFVEEIKLLRRQREYFGDYLKLRIADRAAKAGLSDLEAAVRASVSGKMKPAPDSGEEKFTDEMFRKEVAEGVSYELKDKIWVRQRRRWPWVAAALLAIAGGIYLLAGDGKNPEQERNEKLVQAVTGKKGVEVYKYGAGESFNVDLGNWWTTVSNPEDQSDVRLTMHYKKIGSAEDQPATVLEMLVDEEKKIITPILPEDMEDGMYLLVADMEDDARNKTKGRYEMNVRRHNGDLYMGVKVLKGAKAIDPAQERKYK